MHEHHLFHELLKPFIEVRLSAYLVTLQHTLLAFSISCAAQSSRRIVKSIHKTRQQTLGQESLFVNCEDAVDFNGICEQGLNVDTS